MATFNENYREIRLPNGLLVAMQNTPTQTVIGKLRVNQAAYHEKQDEEGIAHFLEHCLVTGGSKKYAPQEADDMRKILHSNAFTTLGRTYFVGDMLKEDLETWLDYTAEHIFRPRFDEERVNGECKRVLRELSDFKNNPDYKVGLEHGKAFYRGHPKAQLILGKEEIISNASISKIKGFYERGYSPNNTELMLVGNIPKNIEELLENHFGNIPKGNETRVIFPELEPLTQVTTVRNPIAKSSIYVSLSSVGPSKPTLDLYATHIANSILDELLFQDLGLTKGLAYQTNANSGNAYNAGEIHISARISEDRVDEAITAIFENIEKLKDKKIIEDKLPKIKKLAKYNAIKKIESDEGYMGAIESWMDDQITPEDNLREFERVNSEKIIEVANRYYPSKQKQNYIICF